MKNVYDILVPSEWEGEDSFPVNLDDDEIMNNLHETLMPLMKENALQEVKAMEAARKLILV